MSDNQGSTSTATNTVHPADGVDVSDESGVSCEPVRQLTAAEKLQLRRENRRNKILASGDSRLGRITKTFKSITDDDVDSSMPERSSSGSDIHGDSLLPTSGTENALLSSSSSPNVTKAASAKIPQQSVPVHPSLVSQQHLEPRSTLMPTNDIDSLMESIQEHPSFDSGLGVASSNLRQRKDTKTDPRTTPIPQRLFETSMQGDLPDMEFPGLGNSSFSFSQSTTDQCVKPQPSQIWAWLHTLSMMSLALFSLYGISGLNSTSDTNDSMDAVSRFSEYSSACSRISVLSSQKFSRFDADTYGYISGIVVGSNRVSIWVCFLTIEVGLNLLRFIYQRVLSRGTPLAGTIPSELTHILTQILGIHASVFESFSGAFFEAVAIWNSLTNDVLLFVFVIGVGVASMVMGGEFLCPVL
ncbi:hypothetical protein BASA61_009373 [Batrachochytrium salamandrivorans]|nr:hypothetical protein BASA62_002823 [Batrachochytrium salamandrivorans]KAH6580866.1 hypothetical protein BASA61_009373 [Batrachochytrium salamandrivorans]KAJ1344336.1 hypothetical protein BSLG_001071 [Batrachochytrium salamandrivorans]